MLRVQTSARTRSRRPGGRSFATALFSRLSCRSLALICPAVVCLQGDRSPSFANYRVPKFSNLSRDFIRNSLPRSSSLDSNTLVLSRAPFLTGFHHSRALSRQLLVSDSVHSYDLALSNRPTITATKSWCDDCARRRVFPNIY